MKYLFVCSRLDTMFDKRKRLLKMLIENGAEVHLISMECHSATEEAMKALGVQYNVIQAKRNKISFLSDIAYIFSLFTLIRNIKPDVIIGYTIKPNLYTGLVTRFLSQEIKFYPIVTGLGFAFQSGSLLRNLLKKFIIALHRVSFKRAEKIILQNDDNRMYFSQLNIACLSNMKVIAGDGVELPAIEKKQFNSNKRMVCVARLLGEKGLRELHLAMLALKKDYPDFSIELYGAKETSPDAISDLELDEWSRKQTLIWNGYCHSIEELLSGSDAFVLPSYHEGMCTAVSEAISFGLPVVGTDIAGIREMVDDNGFLVKVRDVDSLVESLKALLDMTDDTWISMSERSLELARTKFDRKLLMNEIYEVVT